MHDLINKYFHDNITPEEKELLFSKVLVNNELKDEFASVQNVQALISLLPLDQDKVNGIDSLYSFKKSLRRKHTFPIRHFIGYAAAICVAILSTWSIMTMTQKEIELPPLSYEEFTVPAGQRAQLKLHDGSIVWLSARSTLRYPNYFTNNERRVELDGEAFFDVAKDENNPFIVSTEKLNIEVLGTQFNVFAYKGRGNFNTSLIEGSVRVYNQHDKSNVLQLVPYERAELINNKLIKHHFDDKSFLLWKEGIYAFDDVYFADIMSKLELYYDVTIDINNNQIKQYRFSGKFRQRDGVENVLRNLQKVHYFSYTKDEEKNIITIR